MRKILKRHDIKYVHIKERKGMLMIGMKNRLMKQKYQEQIPEDMFDRRNYYIQQRHHQHHQHYREQQQQEQHN